MTHTIDIAREFSRTPGGRYINDGPFSGELFRERFLVPAFTKAVADDSTVVVSSGWPARISVIISGGGFWWARPGAWLYEAATRSPP